MLTRRGSHANRNKDGKIVGAHYSDEGHGFAKRENPIDAMQRTVEWFDRYLKNKK